MRYLVWDFDGTLGYREGGWSGAMLDVLKANGIAKGIVAGDLRQHILTGFRWHEPTRRYSPAILADAWWEELLGLFTGAFIAVCQVPQERAVELARQVRMQYLRPDAWRLFDDSRPALERLSERGFRHMLLSNHVPELGQLLSLLRIRGCFEHVINSAETGFEKPHPQAYARVLSLLPEGTEATMIGDNPTADYAGAKAAGLKAILVRRFTPGLTPYFSTLDDLVRHGVC